MIIAFIIWSLCTLIFISLGISCFKSKEPVGFFTGVKPPKVTDVTKYNHAVAVLWFVSGFAYQLLGFPLLFLEQNSAGFIPIIFGIMLEMILMMVVYLRIEAKYNVKG